MASNLSSIGFVFKDGEDFRDTMQRLAGEAAERLSCPHGDYAIWRSRTGAEIWFHLAAADGPSGERDIVGLTPFFEGRGEVTLTQMRRLRRPDHNDFEGACSAWLAAAGGDDELYPIVFDAIDAAVWPALESRRSATVRITGFARTLEIHASEAEFLAANTGRANLAAQAFLPMGLFAAATTGEPSTTVQPSSTAIITGRVVEHARLHNEATGHAFDWLLVESYGASFDIVADPELVRGTNAMGATVEAACWLVGRVLD